MKSSHLFTSLLCICLAHAVLMAEEPVPTEQNTTPALQEIGMPPPPQECPLFTPVQANRIGVRQIEGKGVGYRRGYTTVELFATPFMNFDTYLPFLDLRGHRFDDGKYAMNLGMGMRGYLASRRGFWGVNTYYDYRQAHHKNFKQAALGLEYLTLHWDWRINGYYPFGGTISRGFSPIFSHFKGHHIYIKCKHEFAMPGVDAEAAYHWMPGGDLEFTAALGPYYFRGHYNKFAAGAKARAKIEYLNAISLEGIGSYDNFFKWNGQLQIGFKIPLSPKMKSRRVSSCDSSLGWRLVQPVERAEIIVAGRHRSAARKATNPATKEPWHVIFVNNTSSSNGTFESQFPTLVQAQNASIPNDIIYVFPGDGTSTGMNAGITLQNYQQLLGSGVAQKISTSNGKLTIPKQTQSLPLLTNGGGNTVVTLASYNTVSGLQLTGSGAGVAGTLVTSAKILNNIITNSAVIGIFLTDVQGKVHIINNKIVGINGNNDIGINSFNTNTKVKQVIKKNSLTNHQSGGIEIVGAGAASVDTKIRNNSIVGAPVSGFAINVDLANSSAIKADIRKNITMNQDVGIEFASNAPTDTTHVQACVKKNTISTNLADPGAGVAFTGFGIDNWRMKVEKNSISGGSLGGVLINPQGGGGLFVGKVTKNHISNSGGAAANQGGVTVTINGAANFQGTIKKNKLVNNFLGVSVFTNSTGPTCVNIKRNHSDVGYRLQNNDGGVLNVAEGFQKKNEPENSFTIIGPVTTVHSCE